MTGRLGRSQAGQSTVEFAVLLPVLLLAVLVVIQGGLVVRDQLLVQHAAREGARAAAVSDSVAEVRDATGRAGPLDPSRMTVTRSTRQQGQPVRVTVQYRFRGVVPGKRRFADLIGPIDWLVKAGLVYRVHVCTRPELPLVAFTKPNIWKAVCRGGGIETHDT